MKQLFLILISIQYSFGQNTEALFYNLPINSDKKIVEQIMHEDTIRFKKKDVYRWRQKQHITIPCYYPKTTLSLYSPEPENISIVIESWNSKSDSTLIDKISLSLNYFKSGKRSKVKALYNTLINDVKTEYNLTNTKHTTGTAEQENKTWNVYETITCFYKKVGDKNEKLSIVWFDEKKHGQTIFINYSFDN